MGRLPPGQEEDCRGLPLTAPPAEGPPAQPRSVIDTLGFCPLSSASR